MIVTLMFALITTNCILDKKEVDAIVFKSKEYCLKSIQPMKTELLKTACKVELACVERPVYEPQTNNRRR